VITLRERSAAKEHIFQSSAIGTQSQQFLTGVDGRWSMVDGRWSMVDGRWSMVDGRWLKLPECWDYVQNEY
jgi:hypothetical protein